KKNIEILNIFRRYVMDKDLHPYSIDESFLDVTASHQLFGTSYQIAKAIQEAIWDELGLVVTIGIADNPLLAKLALDHDAKHKEIASYISQWRYKAVPRTVWRINELDDFWGIGSRTKVKLQKLGIYSIYDLAQTDIKLLKKQFGIIGEQLFFHAHGIDRTRLADQYIPQSSSYSRNQILNRDYTSQYEIEIVIREMTEENAIRLRKHQQTTGVVKLGIGYSKNVMSTGFSHQLKIEPTDSSKKLISYMLDIFREYYDHQPVRVINVTFGQIEQKSDLQLNLLESTEDIFAEEKRVSVIDHIKERFGNTAILPANSLIDGSTAIYRSNILGGHQADTE